MTQFIRSIQLQLAIFAGLLWLFFARLTADVDDSLTLAGVLPIRVVWLVVGACALLLTLAAAGLFLYQPAFLGKLTRTVTAWLTLPVRVPLAVVSVAAGVGLSVYSQIYLWPGCLLIYAGMMIYWQPADKANQSGARTHLLLIALVLGQVARLVMVYVATPLYDEALYISIGESLFSNGGVYPASGAIDPPIAIYPFWGYTVALHGLWTELFGPTRLAIRWLSYVYGSLMLITLYAACRLWFGRTSALTTVTLASWGWMVFRAMRGRPIALPMLTVALGLLLIIWLQRSGKPYRWHILVGLLSWLLLEAHILNLAFTGAVAVWYLIDYIKQAQEAGKPIIAAPMWYFGVGAVIAAVGYLGVRLVLLDANEYLMLTTVTDRATSPLTNLANAPRLWVSRLSPFLQPQSNPAAFLELILITSSGIVAVVSPSRDKWMWLTILLTALAMYMLLDSIGNPPYFIFLLPLLTLGVGVLFTSDVRSSLAYQVRQSGLLLVLALLIGFQTNTLVFEQSVSQTWQSNFERQFEPFQSSYPSNVTILGNTVMYPFVSHMPYTFVAVAEDTAKFSPALNNMPHDAYWAERYLDLWPRGYLRVRQNIGEIEEVTRSFIAARRAEQIGEQSFIVLDTIPDDDVTILPVEIAGSDDPAIQLAGYAFEETDAGETELYLLWLSGQPLDQALTIEVIVTDTAGSPVDVADGVLFAEGAKAYRFDYSALLLDLPADDAGLSVRISIAEAGIVDAPYVILVE